MAVEQLDPPVRSRWWRIGFGATLTFGMAVGTFTQFALGALGPVLVEDLRMSRAQLGSLSTAYFIVAAVASPVVGTLGEWLGGRRLLLALFAIDMAAFAAMAAAPSYLWLVPAVALAGLAISATNPATNLLIAVHLPTGQRGTVVGVKQSGVQVGSFLAGAVLPALAVAVGWRPTVLALAAVAALGGSATLGVIPADPATPAGRPRDVPRVAAVRWLVPYGVFMGAGVSSVTAYIPLYAHEVLDLTQARAGALLALMGGVGIVARLAWGRIAERRPTTAGPLAVVAGLSVTAGVLLWLAEDVGVWLLLTAAVVFGVSAVSWNAVGMLAIVRESGARGASRASGSVLAGFYGGLLLMPVLFGGIVDATGSYRHGWTLTVVSLTAALVVALAWYRNPAGRQAPPRDQASEPHRRSTSGSG